MTRNVGKDLQHQVEAINLGRATGPEGPDRYAAILGQINDELLAIRRNDSEIEACWDAIRSRRADTRRRRYAIGLLRRHKRALAHAQTDLRLLEEDREPP